MAYKTKLDAKTDEAIKLGGEGNPSSIEGYYLGAKDTPDTGYGPGKLHIFQTEKGNVGVWGKTNINRLLTADHAGQMCLLEFTGMGERRKGRNAAYEYKLSYDEDNTIDTSGLNVNAAEASEDYADDSDSEEEEVQDEVAPARAVPPKVSAKTPDAARQAEVRARLSGRR